MYSVMPSPGGHAGGVPLAGAVLAAYACVHITPRHAPELNACECRVRLRRAALAAAAAAAGGRTLVEAVDSVVVAEAEAEARVSLA